ncbi:MAG: hypothetical protein JOZ08_15715 [Verrucomicrobia bacterium]|nr:hypothetical protein [Verrucomicrobiota bacterium]
MKPLNVLLASFFALATIQTAPAQTVIHITGSTAYRAAVYQAISDILQTGFTFGYTGSTASKASQAIYTGTTKSGNISVIIKTSFSGSVGGISTLAKNLTIGTGGSFTGGGGWLVDSTPQSTTGTPNAPADYDPAITADIALADCFQASAPAIYQTPKLKDNFVGVVPFVWVATPGQALSDPLNHPVTNVTKAQVKTLLVNNTLILSSLTGDSLDTEAVQGVGRDEDSGTRIQALACAGIGVETALKQYQPLYNGATSPAVPPPPPGTQITGAGLWPAVTLNAISYPQGDSGYSSGGSLAAAVNVSHSGSSATYAPWFLTYFGINDAASVTTGTKLAFSGVAYSEPNVEGPGAAGFTAQYTFWGYEHLFYRTTYSAPGLTVAGLLATDLKTTSASVSGILLSAMKVSRDKDGGAIEKGGKPGN